MGNSKIRQLVLIFCISFFLIASSNIAFSNDTAKGRLEGIVYMDGTAPLSGAIVRVKNIASGTEYQSEASGSDGSFLISNVEKGFYLYEVSTPQGESAPGDYFGVNFNGDMSAKIALNVSPWDNIGSFASGDNSRGGHSSVFAGDSHVVFPDEFEMDINCWTPVSPCQTTFSKKKLMKKFMNFFQNWGWKWSRR